MLGERLKQAREAAGMSQAEVARELGLSQPAYSYIENGEKIHLYPWQSDSQLFCIRRSITLSALKRKIQNKTC